MKCEKESTAVARALAGRTGSVVSDDYTGKTVLAAHTYVEVCFLHCASHIRVGAPRGALQKIGFRARENPKVHTLFVAGFQCGTGV